MINLDDQEFKAFERESLAFLRTLEFTPTGYYPYNHFSDMSGYITPKPPFRIPIKTMAEIVKNAPSTRSLDGFSKLAKDSLARLAIIICPLSLSNLNEDTRSLIEKLGIEFFDRETILGILQEKNVTRAAIEELPELYDVVGPVLLASFLPFVALHRIPSEMEAQVNKLELKSWQVFEDIVFSIFHYCFNFATQKLGEERLFEHEPEGIVTIGGTQRFSLLYECKSADERYVMTSDHELRYKDYILKKKNTLRVLNGGELKYFVVIAPEFGGDITERRERIFGETQVLMILFPASVLASFALWTCKLPSDIKNLIDLKSVFKLDEKIVSLDTIKSYIKEFEKNKMRW